MVYRLAKLSRLRTAQVENEINRLNTLPLDEVRRRLKGFLDKYRRKTPTKGPLDGMASSQQEFFALHDTVLLREGTVLGFQEFKPYNNWQSDFFVIGGDGTKEVVARSGDDRIWEIEGPISEKSLSTESYPSIWHYVLVCAKFAGDVADA